MRRMKKGLLSVVLAMALMLAMSMAVYADTAYVTTDGGSVNLRSEASTDSTVLTYLEDGTVVETLGTDGDWTQVSVDGYTGYIMSTYLTVESSDDDDADTDTEESTPGEATVTVGSITYSIASELPDDVLPADYTAVNVDYDGSGYGGAKSSTLDITLLYLTSDSYSGLFIYDLSDGSFLPYLTVGTDEHNVTILGLPSDFTVPEGYDTVTISTDATGLLPAYQLSDPGDLDDTDLYYVYGISNSGTEGWYIIDVAEGTYVRTAEPTDVISSDESGDSSEDAGELSQYKKLLMILALVCVVMLIIIINLLLFYRRGYMYEDDDEYEDDDDEYEEERDYEETPHQQYAPVEPQDTQEIEVPDISALVNDATAEAYQDTIAAEQQVKMQVQQEEETPAEEDELEFFDLDDL